MRNSRLAFTLVELLVVIAIIGILVALLLPAVQAARESARRSQCLNNLKQLALGQHNHESAFKYFACPIDKSGPERSWSIPLLPYIEQQAVYDIYRQDLPWFDTNNTAAISAPLKTFVCPSSPIKSERVFTGATEKGKPYTGYIGDYAACRQVKDTLVATGLVTPPAVVEGLISKDLPRRPADVLDGLSNTIMFGERAGGPKHYINKSVNSTLTVSDGLCWGARANYIQLEGYQADGITTPGPRPMNANNSEYYGFHGDFCNFSFGDGSVRVIRQNVPISVFCALLTASGGETVTE